MTDENGKKVKAIGSDATVDLKIEEKEGNIVITYNGQTFTIPKAGDAHPSSKGVATTYICSRIQYAGSKWHL